MKSTRRIERALHELHGTLGEHTSAGPLDDYVTSSSQSPASSAGHADHSVSLPSYSPGTASSADEGVLPQGHREEADSRAPLQARLAAHEQVQVQKLLAEGRAREARHAEEMNGLREQLEQLQQQAAEDLKELKDRQSQVEASAVRSEEQQQQARDELLQGPLNVTESLYHELKVKAAGDRSLREQVLVLVYERTAALRAEAEELRKERDLAREARERANAEAERQRRESQRAAAALAREHADMEREAASVRARNERLDKDLADARVQVELLTAKGAMYDEVKARTGQLEEELAKAGNERTLAQTSLSVVAEEKERLRSLLRDREHTLELLQMDKAYLSREVSALQEQVGRMEAEAERQQGKVRELKKAKQELYDRILAEKQDTQLAQEQRMQAELQKIQECASRDLENVRRESVEAGERQVRALRDLRDSAVADAERSHLALKDSQAAYDDLALRFRELERSSDRRQTELWTELKVKGAELERLRMMHAEAAEGLKRARLEADMLSDKVKVLSESYHSLDAERTRQVAELRAELSTARAMAVSELSFSSSSSSSAFEAALVKGMMTMDKEGLLTLLGQAPEERSNEGATVGATSIHGGLASSQHRQASAAVNIPMAGRTQQQQQQVQRILNLAKRAARMQTALAAAQAERDEARAKLGKAEAEAARMRQTLLARVAQPQAFLAEAVERAEGQLQQAELGAQALRQDLKRTEAERDELAVQVRDIRNDMRKMLEGRSALEEMRKIVKEGAGTVSAAARAKGARAG